MITPPLTSSVTPKRFTVKDYHRLTALGFLSEDDHTELIRGEIIQMAAKGTAHETCIRRLLRHLPRLIAGRATLQCQSPITLSFDGEPEPDFAIVHNRTDDYATTHPVATDVVMVIEVADSSLSYDREVKLPLYAEAGIPDYWLFNLSDRLLETYSEPYQLSLGQFSYLKRRIVPPDGSIALPAYPDEPLQLEQIFPEMPSAAAN